MPPPSRAKILYLLRHVRKLRFSKFITEGTGIPIARINFTAHQIEKRQGVGPRKSETATKAINILVKISYLLRGTIESCIRRKLCGCSFKSCTAPRVATSGRRVPFSIRAREFTYSSHCANSLGKYDCNVSPKLSPALLAALIGFCR
jgi:hypothetical protein